MYQFQFASVPRLPSFNPRVVLLPGQIGVVPLADVAAIDKVFTIIVTLTQLVVLQIPSLLTKYISEILGLITGEAPEVKNTPPHDPVYQ